MATHTIELLESPAAPEDIRQLVDVLIDCVEGGASISFMSPLSKERAQCFWASVFDSQHAGERLVIVARDAEGRIIGSVQVITAMPENQQHRGDVAKMLVLQSARRQGLGLKLLKSAEEHALSRGKTLLVLDAVTGGEGEALYIKGGWQVVGSIPNFALYPDGRPCATTYMYKELAGQSLQNADCRSQTGVSSEDRL